MNDRSKLIFRCRNCGAEDYRTDDRHASDCIESFGDYAMDHDCKDGNIGVMVLVRVEIQRKEPG